MQKLVKEYMDELNRRHKKSRKVGIAIMLLAVIVVGSVMGVLTQYGIAMTGKAQCGFKEHEHDDDCYEEMLVCTREEGTGHVHTDACRPEKELVCGQEEIAGHTHTDACRPEKELICGLEESESGGEEEEGTEAAIAEGHTHTDTCYSVPEGYVCGLEETDGHAHMDSCYTVSEEFICGLEEGEGHEHADGCYEKKLICKEDEHMHTDVCYIDADADVEDPASWDALYAGMQWSGNWGKDLADAARVQIGYQESEENYTIGAGGVHKGYTRYGHFAGSMYADWDAAFVGFCMHYAGMKASGLFPNEVDSVKWQEEFLKINGENAAYLAGPADYVPLEGDLVFFQKENEETLIQMGIVSAYSQNDNIIHVIEGNSGGAVRENPYNAAEANIISYLKIGELEAAFKDLDLEAEPEQVQDAPEAATPLEPQKIKKKPAKAVGGILAGDDAYVNSVMITDVADGAAPFDGEAGPGNDTDEKNRIVRTFDVVTYNFEVDIKPWNNQDTYSEARVKMEFVLPVTEKEAVFDQTAMAWMDDSEGYQPVVTVEKRVIDGVETECQVLTCYKHLFPSGGNLSVIPGKFGENVTVNVKSMRNGQKFSPIVSAAIEYGTWDGPCADEDHKIDGEPAIEKKTVVAPEVTVTAVPKYNIQLDGNDIYKDKFDFNTGNDLAANQGIGVVEGRLMKAGITIQLYNDNASKGLKGIELPQGPISFDLELSSRYTINTPAQGHNVDEVADTTESYRPLLWSYGGNDWIGYGNENTDGRVIYDELFCTPFAPYSNGKWHEDKNTCWDSGGWIAVQEGNKIHITIKDYEINPDHMPTKNADNGDDKYGANIGCFSAAGFYILQPYNKLNSSSEEPLYDVVKELGQGSFATTLKVTNLKAETVSGAQVEGTQMVTTDDELTRTLELTVGGFLQNRVKYAGKDFSQGSGVTSDRDGRDYAAVGSDVWLMGGFSYDQRSEQLNQLYWGTNLTKFYGSAIELQEEITYELTGGASLDGKTDGNQLGDNAKIYYATKKDGTDWVSDEELLNTYETDLEFYGSLKEIPQGHICVGMLICFKGPGPVKAEGPYYTAYHKAKVKDDMDLAGNTYMLASTSRMWTKDMFDARGMSLEDIPDWADRTKSSREKFEAFPNDHYKSANIEGSTYYKKETYKEDGSGIYGTHNSDWSHWGDTLLIIGFKTKVTKHLMQQDVTGNEKKAFHLDSGQRVVDFKLQPETKHDEEGVFDRTATVTIVDTLPKYLAYKPGSAYFGGVYSQSSQNGGTMGTITGGVQKEPDEIINNEDGTQTLKWNIPDVVIGEPMDAIYYSADIGTKGNAQDDVPSGTTNLLNKVYATSPEDRWEPCFENENYAEEGIAVTRGSASSFGKYTKQKVVDEDGEIDYVVFYNNNSANADHVAMMDTMPEDKINGSHFTGTYEFAGWQLDSSGCDISRIKFYYTLEEQYKDKVMADVGEETIQAEWTEAPVGADGAIELPKPQDTARHPSAWAIIGDLDGGQSVYVELKIKLYPDVSDQNKVENNYFVNRLSSNTITTTTEMPTVRRTLEGLAWLDYDHNGIQNENPEDRISGVRVELLRLAEGKNPEEESSYEPVYYPGTETPVVIETGQQISVRADESQVTWYGTDQKPSQTEEPEQARGRYKFTDLPAGTFAVRFTDGSGDYQISKLCASEPDCGKDDTKDSDGQPVYGETGELEKTVILNLCMPEAKDMSVALYESKYHDSGFYPDTRFTIQKTDASGNRNLSGAIFTIKDSEGKLVSFVADGEDPEAKGSYAVAREDLSSPLAGKYYIAYAANPDYVIGFTGSENGVGAVLQKRTGNELQLFEIEDLEGGYTAFKNAGANKWLDLDSGNNSAGAKIQLWEGAEPDANKQWMMEKSEAQNGSFYIRSQASHMNGWPYRVSVKDAAAEGANVYLWWDGAEFAELEQWLLIPAGISANARTDLSVDTNGMLTIKDLEPGDYTITELKSPDGYALLAYPVEITVGKDGSIEMKQTNDMAGISGEGADTALRIRNAEIYELPSAGGRGIYWYSIGGTLFMLAGALILYRNKRKEALGM